MRRGFTLAEVLVAVAICAMGLLALVSVQILSLKAARANSGRHTAGVLAESVMADIRAQDFGDSVARAEQDLPGHPGFRLRVDEARDAALALKRVDVVIIWTSEQGRQEFVLSTSLVP